MSRFSGVKGTLQSEWSLLQSWTSRSIIFAIFFALTAFYLACRGKLEMPYAAVISALQFAIAGRAIAADHFDNKQADREVAAGDGDDAGKKPDDPDEGQ
jgi:tellurite resistance protein TehA-like permease